MPRLFVHVEGLTEESFVNNVIGPYLSDRGFTTVSARIMGNARLRSRRGGIKPWPGVRDEIIRHLKEDAGRYSTLMVDYYGLPATGDGAWPGRAEATALAYEHRAPRVQAALAQSVEIAAPGVSARFVPYVVMHEYEGLLFSDCQAMARGMARPELAGAFQAIRNAFASPEHINDSPATAPSKRVLSLIPGYEKPLLGTLAALEVGIDSMRAECMYFDNWLSRLEERA